MLKYHVKKPRRRRYTYRIMGLVLMLVCGTEVVMLAMGYGRGHILGGIICILLLMYGFYLLAYSFKSTSYDIDYEFNEDKMIVHTHYGDKTYAYSEIDDVNQIIPENELIYSLIHITIGKTSYLLPFSYKKEVSDTIYKFLNERVTSQKLETEASDSE